MNACPVRYWTAVTVIFCYWGIAVDVANGQSRRDSLTDSTAETSDSVVCAIIGDVRIPGAYRFTEAQPTMSGLVEFAGGVSEGATGIRMRVLGSRLPTNQADRDQRGWSDDRLLAPGDVVVVSSGESRFASRKHTLHHGPLPSARTSKKSHIALIGILKEPVVLPLPNSDPILADLLNHLRQPRNLSTSVRIFQDGLHRDRGVVHGSLKLKDGMLIVFDPRAIRGENLPRLPRAYSATERQKRLAALERREQSSLEISDSKRWQTDSKETTEATHDHHAPPPPEIGVRNDAALQRELSNHEPSLQAKASPVDLSDKQSESGNNYLLMTGAVLTLLAAARLYFLHRRRSREMQSRLSSRIEAFVKRKDCETANKIRMDEADKELTGPQFLREEPVALSHSAQMSDDSRGVPALKTAPAATPLEKGTRKNASLEEDIQSNANSGGLMHRVLRQLQDNDQ